MRLSRPNFRLLSKLVLLCLSVPCTRIRAWTPKPNNTTRRRVSTSNNDIETPSFGFHTQVSPHDSRPQPSRNLVSTVHPSLWLAQQIPRRPWTLRASEGGWDPLGSRSPLRSFPPPPNFKPQTRASNLSLWVVWFVCLGFMSVGLPVVVQGSPAGCCDCVHGRASGILPPASSHLFSVSRPPQASSS